VAGKHFPVVNSTLSAQALADRVLSKYALDLPVRCQFIQKGVSDTYEVESGSYRLYLRVYRSGWRTRPEIEAEMAMLDFLDKRKQPVSRPVRRRDGTFLIRLMAPEGVLMQRFSRKRSGKSKCSASRGGNN